MRSAVLLGFLVGWVGCMPPPPVYRVQRSARVPRPAVPLRTGEPLAGPIEISVGASSVGDVQKPRLADTNASLEVPGEQLRGEVRIRLGRRGEIAPFYEHAVESSVTPLDATQAPVEDGTPTAIGLATRYSIDTGTPLSIGIGVELMSWRIPYVEYRTCVEFCEENNAPLSQMLTGTDSVGTFGFGVTPTYRTGNFALFGGAYTRRHPTIVRKGSEYYEQTDDEELDAGTYNWMLHAGVEYRMPIVSLLATVQQNLTSDPVIYGPSFGLAIAIRAPDPTPRRARPPEPTPRHVDGPPGRTDLDHDAELPDDPW